MFTLLIVAHNCLLVWPSGSYLKPFGPLQARSRVWRKSGRKHRPKAYRRRRALILLLYAYIRPEKIFGRQKIGEAGPDTHPPLGSAPALAEKCCCSPCLHRGKYLLSKGFFEIDKKITVKSTKNTHYPSLISLSRYYLKWETY